MIKYQNGTLQVLFLRYSIQILLINLTHRKSQGEILKIQPVRHKWN